MDRKFIFLCSMVFFGVKIEKQSKSELIQKLLIKANCVGGTRKKHERSNQG
jgi:hypothetical protein